jgi:hypothetical protein
VYPAAGYLAGVQSPKNLGDITPEYKTGDGTRFSEGTSPMTKPPAAALSTLLSGNFWGCRSASMRSPLLDAPWTQKGWCPGSSWILTAVIYMFIMDCQQRITVGGASCACVSQGDSMGLHNVGGRMGEFRLLYLLCMLRFPVPLHSLQCVTVGICRSSLLIAHVRDFALHALTLYRKHSECVLTVLCTGGKLSRTRPLLPWLNCCKRDARYAAT